MNFSLSGTMTLLAFFGVAALMVMLEMDRPQVGR